jgi:hypothetical protein
MFRVVLHHTYTNGRATDVSGSGNHGVPRNTTPGAGPGYESSLRWDRPESDVRVEPSASLRDLDAIRVRVRFLYRPGDLVNRRHNLIEGHLSFALFITPHGGLMGTILDANNQWRGAQVGPGAVKQVTWHTAELRHDGHSTLELLLDGAVVAAAYDVPGPVRSVGRNGVAVGHWPEPDGRYTLLTGFIDDVVLAKRELEPDDLLDPCCANLSGVDDLLAGARAEGMTDAEARDLLRQARMIEARTRSLVIGGDPARAERASELANQGAAAMATGDPREVLSVMGRTVDFMRQRASEADIVAIGHDTLDLVAALSQGKVVRDAAKSGRLPDLSQFGPALAALCLATPPDRPDRGQRPPRPDGDEHTDGDDGGRRRFVDGLDPGPPDDEQRDPEEERKEREARERERRPEQPTDDGPKPEPRPRAKAKPKRTTQEGS